MSQVQPPGWKREFGIAFIVIGAASMLFTWPLLPNISATIPSGCGPPTVSLFGLFTVEWTGHFIEQGRAYLNAPIFYPHTGTLAWSEPQPATGIAVWALWKVVGLIPAYNIVLLLYLVAAGCAGFALARQLTNDRVAAIWSGVWLSSGAYSIQQLGVLHLVAFFFPVGCLALVLSLFQNVRWWAVWGSGLAYLLTWLTCAQFGFFLTLLLPFVVTPIIPWKLWCWRRAAYLCAPFILATLIVCPLQLRHHGYLVSMGFERSLDNVTGVLKVADLVTPAKGHWLTTRILEWDRSADVYSWDLGIVPLLCIFAAGFLHLYRRRPVDPAQKPIRLSLVILSVTALLLAFGPSLGVSVQGKNLGPYALLHSTLPGFDSIRSPARLTMFAIVGVAVLSAPAFASVRNQFKNRRGRQAVTVAGFVLLFSEMWAIPISLTEPNSGLDDHQEAINWMQQHIRGAPVLELPMSKGDKESDLLPEVCAMRRALRHGSPVINGYSGFFPEPFRQLRTAVMEDLGGRGRRFIDALGTRFVLVHLHDLPPASRSGVVEALGGMVVFGNGLDSIIQLPKHPLVHRTQLAMSNPSFDVQPRAGDVLRIAVDSVPERASLLISHPGHSLPITWRDTQGQSRQSEILLRGSVLVDAGERSVYLLLLRFSDQGEGEAVLISQQRVPGSGRIPNP